MAAAHYVVHYIHIEEAVWDSAFVLNVLMYLFVNALIVQITLHPTDEYFHQES